VFGQKSAETSADLTVSSFRVEESVKTGEEIYLRYFLPASSWFLIGLTTDSEGGGDIFFRNVGPSPK
jgi:hypothetical protein